MRQKKLYHQIKNGVTAGILKQPFSVKDVNKFLNNILLKSSAFLPKHCVDNPGNYSEMFIRVSRGKYKLNPAY